MARSDAPQQARGHIRVDIARALAGSFYLHSAEGMVSARIGAIVRVFPDGFAGGTRRLPLHAGPDTSKLRVDNVRPERVDARLDARGADKPPAAPQALYG